MLEIKDICVIGLGYVGLPTATILANEGFSVLGVDINQDLIEMLKKGKFDFQEPKLEELFSKNILKKTQNFDKGKYCRCLYNLRSNAMY